jgi:hypothetical protein
MKKFVVTPLEGGELVKHVYKSLAEQKNGSASRYGWQKCDFVAVSHLIVHPGIVGVDRTRNRALVAAQVGKLIDELGPDGANRRIRPYLTEQFSRARNIT